MENKNGKSVKNSVSEKSKEQILNITLIPDTWIIAPTITREQLERYIKKGWLTDEDIHLDRAFPRNSEGKPVIYRIWLRSPINKVVSERGMDRKLLDFRIVDDDGTEVNYIVINDKPLKYRRSIEMRDKNKRTTEYYEYIDATFDISFNVKTDDPKNFIKALALAGKEKGLFSRTKHGFGKFKIIVNG